MTEVITYHHQPIEITIQGRGYGYYAIPSGVDISEGSPDFQSYQEIPDEFIDLDVDFEDACRLLALRIHLDDWEPSSVELSGSTGYLDYGSQEWLVLTDYEADSQWEARLLEYIDDCMEIPDSVRPYFDEKRWLEDAKIDGRGHTLSSYDGNEWEVEIDTDPEVGDTETYYLYRVN